MEQLNISLPHDFAIPDGVENLLPGLTDLLNPNGQTLPDLLSAIQYENKPKFGPSTISNLQWEVVSFNVSKSTGRLRFIYDMQLTFGCEDFVKDHTAQHSYYNFHFNKPKNVLHLESDAPEPASTANEF